MSIFKQSVSFIIFIDLGGIMQIRSSVVNLYNKAQQRVLDLFPSKVCINTKKVNFIKSTGKNISSAEQRLILGASALLSQPFIDGHNKNVDEKTRKVSVARTIAKIIAGTTTGFLIRKGCIKGIEALSQPNKTGIPIYKKIFTPLGIKDTTTDAFMQYRNAIGTVVALIVMMFTNFLIDAPLTRYLTNLFIMKQEDKDGIAK